MSESVAPRDKKDPIGHFISGNIMYFLVCLVIYIAAQIIFITWPVNIALVAVGAIWFRTKDIDSFWAEGINKFLKPTFLGLIALAGLVIVLNFCGLFSAPSWVIKAETAAVFSSEHIEALLNISPLKFILIFSCLAIATILSPALRSAEYYSKSQDLLRNVHLILIALTAFTLCSPFATRPWRKTAYDQAFAAYQAQIRKEDHFERRALAANFVALDLGRERSSYVGYIVNSLHVGHSNQTVPSIIPNELALRRSGALFSVESGDGLDSELSKLEAESEQSELSNPSQPTPSGMKSGSSKEGGMNDRTLSSAVPNSPDGWENASESLNDEEDAVKNAAKQCKNADELLNKQVEILQSLLLGKISDFAAGKLPDLISTMIGSEVDSYVEEMQHSKQPNWISRIRLRKKSETHDLASKAVNETPKLEDNSLEHPTKGDTETSLALATAPASDPNENGEVAGEVHSLEPVFHNYDEQIEQSLGLESPDTDPVVDSEPGHPVEPPDITIPHIE